MNKKVRIPVRKEAIPFLGLFAVLGVLFYPANHLVGIILIIPSFLIIYFFRDPHRRIPQSPELIVSPSDGRVREVRKTYENEQIKNKATQISIVLSLFDVHIARSPIEGEINCLRNERGKYFPAFSRKASLENSRSSIGIENKEGRILVRLISGAIARKIICFVKKGERLQKGKRLGLIVLGSRTEIILPLSVEILTKKGTKVKAGETVLARWK